MRILAAFQQQLQGDRYTHSLQRSKGDLQHSVLVVWVALISISVAIKEVAE